MATPQVAAFAAKIRQYFMQGYYYTSTSSSSSKSFEPSGALLKAVLVHSAQPMAYSKPFTLQHIHSLSCLSVA